ncbi:Uma2 family endonuclease [Rhodopirellula sp. JC639]|uniref:Uma2 family endonuclease n=1 Tax=Stieleria mannarensis TaxID=2755585 RepID=UPI001601F95E|nr:Uma2 family endonuclease [Rhodopirellula sp. JC639]
MSSIPRPSLSEADYLARERLANSKSEFYRGEVFAMAGASRRHNLITGNIVTSLNLGLRDSDCQVFPSDMRVKIPTTGLMTYPDVSVACGEPEFNDDEQDTLTNPVVLVEVLSRSTEAYDRGAKFEQYRNLQSLRHYLLIAQERLHVEHFSLQADGNWLLQELNKPGGVAQLKSIDCELPVDEIYRKVDVSDAEEYGGGGDLGR